ncbi:MotA/TolQ/ExbB proton channel family protein [Paraburkholderia solisilvae]|nr:MotA/TolQ/ExbB proton channel family protein [Paraburkholderia solisilvae]
MSSGGILFIMPLLFLVTLTVSLERVWFLARLKETGRRVIKRVEALKHLDMQELNNLLRSVHRQPLASVLRVPLNFPELRDHVRLADRLEEAILLEVPRMDRSLWLLDTAVTLSPLLGLLGTIIGMFNSFQVLGQPGTAPTQITGGIAEALVATASGLLVAIVGLIFLNALQTRVRLLVHDMETLKTMLINRLDGSDDGARK